MKTYTLTPEGYNKKFRATGLASGGAVFVLIAGLVLYSPTITTLYVLIFLAVSFPIIFVVQMRPWKTLKFTFDSNTLTAERRGVANIVITPSDVKRILAYRDGSLRVETHDSSKAILIPPGITDYSELRANLQLWHHFTEIRIPFVLIVVLIAVVITTIVFFLRSQ
jgi:hypothetical protein